MELQIEHVALKKAFEDDRSLQVLADEVPELKKSLGKVHTQLKDSNNTSRKRRRGLDKITEVLEKIKNGDIYSRHHCIPTPPVSRRKPFVSQIQFTLARTLGR
ncbi:hypothetical protein A4X09_0g7320 [Tilletia walkeri]|uniref:Uncharacterized protein n=1 Tax=Tilletia walkeri TaxID=117179 RepID=A0A8X7N2D1_9BASI|nr:hypothetical protein A4X09_0g7320 [Tilletia walkeri]